MGGEVITSRIISPKEAAKVLNDPEIYDRISNDNCPDTFDEYPDTALYIGGYVNGQLVSVSIIHETKIGYKFHYQVLKQHRKYAGKLLKQAIGPILQICESIYCEIPSLYRSVINFASKHGFEVVEIKNACYPKNGINYDVHVMVKTL